MSRRVTFADEAQPDVRRTRVRFWDGMQSSCLMPNITSKGTGTPGTAGAWLTHVWGFPWGGPGSAGGLFLGSEMRGLFS